MKVEDVIKQKILKLIWESLQNKKNHWLNRNVKISRLIYTFIPLRQFKNLTDTYHQCGNSTTKHAIIVS